MDDKEESPVSPVPGDGSTVDNTGFLGGLGCVGNSKGTDSGQHMTCTAFLPYYYITPEALGYRHGGVSGRKTDHSTCSLTMIRDAIS